MAAVGYYRAGFTEIVGIDIKPQPRYPFTFIQADALTMPVDLLRFDAIHASPPCQAFTKARKLQGNTHPDLLEPIRTMLRSSGKPFVIENVPGAPLVNPVILCGLMFGLKVIRHRLFESNVDLPFQLHSPHPRQRKLGAPVVDGDYIQVVGHFSGVPYAQAAMGIDWMGQKELAQAIPPAYTEWIGRRLLENMP